MSDSPLPLDKTLTFSFMIFQGNPRHESIYYWLDGSREKHKMKRDDFIKLVREKNENLVADAWEGANTYSFYLWNQETNKIQHLFPKSNNEPYPDSVQNIVQGKAKPKRLVRESQSIEDILIGYGFNPPTASSVANLQVSIDKKERDQGDKFGMIRRLLRGR